MEISDKHFKAVILKIICLLTNTMLLIYAKAKENKTNLMYTSASSNLKRKSIDRSSNPSKIRFDKVKKWTKY